MKRVVAVLMATAALSYVAGTGVVTPSVTSSPSQPQVVATSRDAANDDGALDAYGNEVTNAVAEYSLDPAGSLYERHAPQIEIPHLGSPTS